MEYLYILVAMFATIMVLDYVWLGIITKNFIIEEFGSLIKVKGGSIEIKLGIGLLAWFMIALGTFIFAVFPATSMQHALILGAIFGFISYSIYDLTNLTFITGYSVRFVMVDILWGTVLCTMLSAAGFFIKSLF